MTALIAVIVILVLLVLITASSTIRIAKRRAKIIATDGEFQAAQVLANAAEIIATQPAALALRYMQTLLDMGSNQNSTIVFPIPIELIKPLLATPVPMDRPAPAHAMAAVNGASAAPVTS